MILYWSSMWYGDDKYYHVRFNCVYGSPFETHFDLEFFEIVCIVLYVHISNEKLWPWISNNVPTCIHKHSLLLYVLLCIFKFEVSLGKWKYNIYSIYLYNINSYSIWISFVFWNFRIYIHMHIEGCSVWYFGEGIDNAILYCS